MRNQSKVNHDDFVSTRLFIPFNPPCLRSNIVSNIFSAFFLNLLFKAFWLNWIKAYGSGWSLRLTSPPALFDLKDSPDYLTWWTLSAEIK
jgi:hypothetical protein